MDKVGKYPKNWIRDLRTKKGWSLRELAKLAGFPHYQTLNNLELSRAELTHSHIIRLSNALGCHPLEITEGPAEQIVAKDDSEKELLEAFRGLDDSAKSMYLHGLRTYKDAAPAKKTEPQPNKEKKTS